MGKPKKNPSRRTPRVQLKRSTPDKTPPPFIVADLIPAEEVQGLRAQAAATTAWTALAHQRLSVALGRDPSTSALCRPTLGAVLEKIEELVSMYSYRVASTALWYSNVFELLCAALEKDPKTELQKHGKASDISVSALLKELVSERARIRELVDMSNEQILKLVDQVYEEAKSATSKEQAREAFDKFETDSSLVGSLARRLAEQADAIEAHEDRDPPRDRDADEDSDPPEPKEPAHPAMVTSYDERGDDQPGERS